MEVSLVEFLSAIEPVCDVEMVSMYSLNVVCTSQFGKKFVEILGEFLKLVDMYDEFNMDRMDECNDVDVKLIEYLSKKIIRKFLDKNCEKEWQVVNSHSKYESLLKNDLKVTLC